MLLSHRNSVRNARHDAAQAGGRGLVSFVNADSGRYARIPTVANALPGSDQ